MSTFKIISPIHIGSGETYENFLIHNDYRYDFNDFVAAVFKERKAKMLDQNFLDQLKKLAYRNTKAGKEQIKEVIMPSQNQIAAITPLYPVVYELNPRQLNEKSIAAFVKTMNRPYIPGSSIKGYLLNVIFYDMITNDARIRNHITSMLSEAVRQMDSQNRPNLQKTYSYREYVKLERDVLTEASQFLICRDVMIDQPMAIYYVSRQTRKGQIPQVAEFIDEDFESQGDVIVINTIKPEKRYDHSIRDVMIKAFVDRIKQLKSNLQSMNAPYIKNTLAYQKKFIEKHRDNSKINQVEVNEQIRYTIERLDEGAIVFQLGKYTNYITKSHGMAFGLDFYEEVFKEVFRPDRKTKVFEIGSMNLIAYSKDDQDFDQIPGYVVFEW